jgi:hypothetical protein
VILQHTDPHVSMCQTLHRKYSQITEYDFSLLSLFEDKQRAEQCNIQYHISHYVNAILTGVNTDINRKLFLL